MKVFRLLLFCVFISLNVYSQTAYYDAIKIENILINDTLPKDSISKFINVMKNYLPENIQRYPDNIILSKLYNKQGIEVYNPFFKDIIAKDYKPEASLRGQKTGIVSSAISTVGGLDVTNIADGLAKFMVERAKEELNVAFFSRFQEELLNDKYEDLRLLFPQTYNLLKMMGTEIYKFDAYLSVLREAFQQDLANVFINFQDVIRSEKYEIYFENNKSLKAIIESSLFIFDELSKGTHPGDILADYSESSYLDNMGDTSLIGSIKTLQLFSESLISRSTDHYWISADSVKLLFKDNNLITFRIQTLIIIPFFY